MSRLTTIFLALAAVVVLTAYLLVRFAPGSGVPRAGEALFRFDPDKIRGIEITNGDTKVELRRTDTGWRMGPDPSDRASGELISKILTHALETPVLDRIAAREVPDRDDLSEYGLRSSRMKLDFRGDGGRTLLFGKSTADDSRVYVRFEGGNDICVIPDELATLIFRPAGDFRDSRVSNLRPDRVERFVIRQPAGEMEIRREHSGWRIVKPMRALAAEQEVSDFLSRALSLRAEGFSEAGDAGGDPEFEIQFFGEGDREPETLTFLGAGESGKLAVRYSGRPGTLILPPTAKSLVSGNLGRFRDPAAARVNLDLVDKVVVTRRGKTSVFTRDGEDWAENGSGGHAAEIERLVAALASVRLEDFQPASESALAEAGVAMPQDSVRFLSVVSENTPEAQAGEQTVAAIAIGPLSEDGRVAVHTEGAAEFGRAPATFLEALPAAP